jgi:hypothetical protein
MTALSLNEYVFRMLEEYNECRYRTFQYHFDGVDSQEVMAR